ncbi:hypothetical protein MKK88_21210 [Methylobacterium sp. E-005]|uniref:hypothetical protein n=1 Tax=Methylobacterium sp. E-005 TaxID=2836549 RepID=UPI001FBB2284|nr:hypothetical protein [Methylobacterium sp. E-005]MCJ2088480.1 hypothetical protein [Methylobacterium sp. E-005]
MDKEEVLALLGERITKEGGIAAWARRHAVSEQYTRDVVARRRPPGPGILKSLGLQKDVTTYSEVQAHG